MALHLVRHGPPLMDPSVPASQWQLDPDQERAVRDLAASGVLPDDARWVSSDEPKALQTARLLAGDAPVEVREELREQYRPAGWVDAYAVRVHRSLTRPGEPAEDGWETADSTRARVVHAVQQLVEETPGDLVVVGHGTAWTLAVSDLTGAPVDLVAWERMLMPDHCAIEGRRVVRRWGDWHRP
ncbi:MAG: histidine phosphatase family protein [Actinomycetes bacterium]